MSTIDKIFELLTAKGYQQKDLTDHLGIDKGVASQWKSGKSQSYNKYIAQIAAFLGVSVNDLVGTDEDRTVDYLDDETRELLDALRKRPEMRTLFKAARDATREDIEAASDIIERLRE